MSNYRCPICDKEVPRDLVVFLRHGEEHIVDEIKKKHPEWVSQEGLCAPCLDYYKKALHGEI